MTITLDFTPNQIERIIDFLENSLEETTFDVLTEDSAETSKAVHLLTTYFQLAAINTHIN